MPNWVLGLFVVLVLAGAWVLARWMSRYAADEAREDLMARLDAEGMVDAQRE